MSASSCCVTCGTLTQLACSRGPEIFWMRDNGSVSMRPYFAKSTLGTAGSALAAPPPPCMISLTNALTSSAVTRPLAPEPRTRPRSTPSSRASLRTDGPACASPNDVGVEDTAPRAGAAARVRRRLRARPRAQRSAAARRRAGAVGRGGLRPHRSAAARAADRLPTPCRRRRTLSSSTRPASGAGTSIAGLLGLERHEPLLGGDLVAGLHENVDDLDVREIAEVRHDHGARSGRGGRDADALELRLPDRAIVLRAVVDGRRGGRCGARGFECRNDAARRDAIADLDLQRRDVPCGRRRNVHRGLFRLERDEPLLRRYRIAGLDEDFDDLDVGKVTKIGYDDFHGLTYFGAY